LAQAVRLQATRPTSELPIVFAFGLIIQCRVPRDQLGDDPFFGD